MRSNWARLLLLAGALTTGCQQSANSLLVDLSNDGAKPAALVVSIYDAHGSLLLAKKLTVKHWPGTMEIEQLPASSQTLRLVVATDAQPPALGDALVMFVQGKQTRVAVALSSATPDQDHDGVPDAVDDCPTVADPQQQNSAGTGPGDACRDAADMSHAPVPDLGEAAPDLSPPPDMTPPIVASNCPSVTSGLCDGFENGIGGFWSATQTGGALSIDATRAYRGTHSLKVHNDAFAAGTLSDVRLTETTTLSGTAPPDLYLRAFMYLPATAPNPVQLVTSVQSVSPYLGIGLVMDQGQVASYDSVSGGVYLKSVQALPLGQWFCLQWHAHLATDTTGYMQLSIDGQDVTAVRGSEPTQPSPVLKNISVGASFYNPPAANPAFDLWVDEVEIGTAPIQCTD